MSRSSRQSRHHGDEHPVVPRVPIIPMLDMSFQLLSFGLYSFDLTADRVEGQLTLALPQSGVDSTTPVNQSPTIEEPEESFTIRVASDGNGRVKSIELVSTKITTPEALPLEFEDLVNNLASKVEKKTTSNEKAPKLEMQFDKDLNYQVVFELLSAADKAKFERVTPNLLGANQNEPAPEKP